MKLAAFALAALVAVGVAQVSPPKRRGGGPADCAAGSICRARRVSMRCLFFGARAPRSAAPPRRRCVWLDASFPERRPCAHRARTATPPHFFNPRQKLLSQASPLAKNVTDVKVGKGSGFASQRGAGKRLLSHACIDHPHRTKPPAPCSSRPNSSCPASTTRWPTTPSSSRPSRAQCCSS